MKTISISEAKAALSEQIRHVKRGEEVVITDRGRPVARLVPAVDRSGDAEMAALEASGLIRRGTGELPRDFWKLPRPKDPQAALREGQREEREGGW